MKDIKNYILESSKIYEGKLNINDVVGAIENNTYGDDWPLDPHGNKTGEFADAYEQTGSIADIFDFCDTWDAIADELNCDVDELQDFVYDNEEKIAHMLNL